MTPKKAAQIRKKLEEFRPENLFGIVSSGRINFPVFAGQVKRQGSHQSLSITIDANATKMFGIKPGELYVVVLLNKCDV